MAANKIDVHSHFLPPFYREACIQYGHANPDGMPYLPDWSEEDHLKLMLDNGITKSILSISSPGTHLVWDDKELVVSLTRRCNAFAAELKARKPEQFSYWASLPIPEVDLCLEEIDRAIEEGCDGFAMLTNGHGYYLGDPALDPIFDKLNEEKATLFIHPTTPCIKCDPTLANKTHADCKVPTKATPLADRYPNPTLEFMFDTARVVTNLFLSGTMARCPDIKIVLPHLAGASAPLLSRWTTFSSLLPGNWTAVSEDDAMSTLNRQFWFDLAGLPFPGQIVGLMQGSGVRHDRLLYGSDYPFTRAEGVAMLRGRLEKGLHDTFSPEQITDICHGNAEALLEK